MEKKYKYLIIWWGITWISFANFKKEEDFLILEWSNEVWWYCKTIKKWWFIWDYSWHFFHFQNKEIHDLVFKNINDEDIINVKNKITSIYYKGNYIDFPFQKNIHQLDKEDFIECLYDLFKRSNKDVNSFKEMVVNNFWNWIANKFLIPYNEKLYCIDLDKLDKDAMWRFFPYASIDEIVENFKNSNNNSYNSSFTYHKGWAIEYINSLLKNFDNSKILLNQKIEYIDKKAKYVRTQKWDIFYYENLINTSPLNKLLKYLNDDNSNILSSNKVFVFNIWFNKWTSNKNHWVYFPENKYVFYRIGFYNNILWSDKLSLYIEIWLKEEEKYDEKDLLDKVIDDLKQSWIIDDHEIEAYSTVLMEPAYAHIKKASEDFKNSKLQELKNDNIFSIWRYWEWKYCSIEDNIIDAKKLSLKI